MMNSGLSQQREPAPGWTASWAGLSGLVCGEGGYITPRKGTLHSVCPLPSLARSRQPEKHLTITHFPSTVGRVWIYAARPVAADLFLLLHKSVNSIAVITIFKVPPAATDPAHRVW